VAQWGQWGPMADPEAPAGPSPGPARVPAPQLGPGYFHCQEREMDRAPRATRPGPTTAGGPSCGTAAATSPWLTPSSTATSDGSGAVTVARRRPARHGGLLCWITGDRERGLFLMTDD
jgi:hypothetical protein